LLSHVRKLGQRYRDAFAGQLDDLPLAAFVQWGIVGAGWLLAKALAVRHTFPGATIASQLGVTLRAMAFDLLCLAAFLLLVIVTRSLPRLPDRARVGVFIAGGLAALAALTAMFANVEFFASWGAPLSAELLQLAPHLAQYILMVGASDKTGTLAAGGLVALAGVLLGPALVRLSRRLLTRGGSWRLVAWLVPTVLAAAGLVLAAAPPRDYREAALRRLSLALMILPHREQAHAELARPHPSQQAALARLLGPASDAGQRALAPLPRRRLNVVLWIWEAVGARYLRSLHPRGEVATPALDRALARGSVEFSRTYTECPLTVQTTWALVTGQSPPAKPFVFALKGYQPGVEMPPHRAALHGELGKAGYRTALFYSSYTRMWGTFRIFELAPLDVFEDADTLAASGNVQEGLGVDDEVTLRKSLEWLETLPREQPFFLMHWNTEPHKPYTYLGMGDELRRADDYTRYKATLRRADQLFGQFYGELERHDLLEDTLIVVIGDHGEGMGRPPRPFDLSHSFRVFEDAIHVPLLFLHPSLAAGGTPTHVPTLASHVDVFPTLLDLLGLPPVEGLDGRSLARSSAPRPFFARSLAWWPLAIIAGQHKLILSEAGGSASLFDLASDDLEQDDLMSREAETGQLLLAELYRWHAQRFRDDPTFGYPFMRLVPMPDRR